MKDRSTTTAKDGRASKRMIVSGYTTSAEESGIFLYDVAADGSSSAEVASVGGIESPSFCQLAEARLYVAGEAPDHGCLAVLPLGGRQALSPGNLVAFGGASGTCFVLAEGRGAHRVFGANYDSGSVAVAHLRSDGGIDPDISLVQHVGHSVPRQRIDPHFDRQASAHVHTLSFVPGTSLLAAVDLGLDAVILYATDEQGCIVSVDGPAFVNECPGGATEVELPPQGDGSGAALRVIRALPDGRSALAQLPVMPAGFVEVPLHYGPRIVAYHPRRPLAALICELACKVLLYRIGEGGLRWELLEEHDLLHGAPNIGSDGRPPLSAHCAFSGDGRFLYTSTRGTDQLETFEVGEEDSLSLVATVFCEGDAPRHFALSSDGSLLAVANQTSGNVSVFKRDSNTGTLKVGHSIPCGIRPSCIAWA